MDWQTLRNTFMKTIGGDPPGAQLEDDLIQAYTNHPDAVERSFEKIALAHKAGKIRSPWGALKAEVAKATEAARNPHHDTGATQTKAIARAEQWLRTAGLHYDRESEILDELFGDRGILHAFKGQPKEPLMRLRILTLYRELRPRGEQVEAEASERGLRHQANRATLDNMPNKPLDETELRALARAKAADTTRLA